MSAAKKFAPHYTIDDYRHWKGDWELWDGAAIAMSPSPFGKHQRVLGNLFVTLRQQMESPACGGNVVLELDWIVRADTIVRPDLIVVCGAIPDRHLERAPALVAEILSPSTRQNDLTYKRDLYAQQRVGTYIIVDPDAKTVEHLQLSPDGTYASQAVSDAVKISVCHTCELEISPTNLF
ncbi:MAG: Uma2 family endonuclease [Planctomycetota bacterium]